MYIDSPNISAYPHPKWVHLAVSEAREVLQDGDSSGEQEAKTKNQCYDEMRKAVQAEYDKGCDLPTVTLKVDFVNCAEDVYKRQSLWHEQNSFNWDQWDHLLSDAERDGIRSYTGIWYSAMNTMLREGKPSAANVQKFIDGATSGLAKWQTAHDMVTFRGANLHWTANLLGGTETQMSDAAFLQSRIGMVVTDKGFMSTGTHQDSAWRADVKYTIFARKGVQRCV